MHYRYGAPAPYELVIWQIAETFGWTLDYIESLPLARLHEWLEIQDARGRNAESRKPKGK